MDLENHMSVVCSVVEYKHYIGFFRSEMLSPITDVIKTCHFLAHRAGQNGRMWATKWNFYDSNR